MANRGRPCDRAYNPARCLVAHALDRCGSVRPQKLWHGFQRTQQEQNTLQHVPLVAVSNFIRTQLARAGYPPENLHVLHLFAPDVSAAPVVLPDDTQPRFVVIGRVTETKGIKWLLQALREVKVEVRLDIVGDGPLILEMKALAQQLGIVKRVRFHGWVQPDEVAKLIQAARALVFPSIWHEPGGTVAFEAMFQGRAVIMSRVGGMPEVVVDGKTGLLVEPNDVFQLAAAIEHLATDYDFATTLGLAGYEQVCQRFTRSQHVEQLIELYVQTIHQKRHDMNRHLLNEVATG